DRLGAGQWVSRSNDDSGPHAAPHRARFVLYRELVVHSRSRDHRTYGRQRDSRRQERLLILSTNSPTERRQRAIFFDRDGVINTRIKGGYVRSWDELEINPDLADVLRSVKAKGYLAIIVTNQRGVGRGLMTETDLHTIHQNLQTHLFETIGTQ